jgi:hypothetical protein
MLGKEQGRYRGWDIVPFRGETPLFALPCPAPCPSSRNLGLLRLSHAQIIDAPRCVETETGKHLSAGDPGTVTADWESSPCILILSFINTFYFPRLPTPPKAT